MALAGKPWVERYRPATLDDVIAHDEILSTLRRLMDSNNLPHLLFYGPPGTGKTTTVHACARHLFGNNFKGNVLEMNASDDRGIDIVRNEIRDFASTSQVFFSQPQQKATNLKLVVLDEADQMSNEAQAALRRVIEKYTRNVRFCIICNHVNKIIPALQSRCTRFRFGPVRKEQMLPRLQHIVQDQAVAFTPEGLAAAYKLSNGDMRRCLNTMQAAAMSTDEITEESVYRSTGNPTPTDVRYVVETMLSAEFSVAWRSVSERVHTLGLSVVDLLREVHGMLQVLDLPQDSKCFCYVQLAEVECNLASGTGESIALGALLAVMQLVREAVTSGKSIETVTAPVT